MKKTAAALLFVILLLSARGDEACESASVAFRFGAAPERMTVVKMSRIWDGTVLCKITFPPGYVSRSGASEDESSVETTINNEAFDRILRMFDQDDVRQAFECDESTVLDGEMWLFRKRIGGRLITMVYGVGGDRPRSAAVVGLAIAIVTTAGRPDLVPTQ